MLSLLYTQAM